MPHCERVSARVRRAGASACPRVWQWVETAAARFPVQIRYATIWTRRPQKIEGAGELVQCDAG